MQAIQTLHSHPQEEPEHLHNVEGLPPTLCPPSAMSAMAAQALYDPRLLLRMVPLSAPHSPEVPFSDRLWMSQDQFALFFHLWFRHDLLLTQEGFLVDIGTLLGPSTSQGSANTPIWVHICSQSVSSRKTQTLSKWFVYPSVGSGLGAM